MPYDKAKFTEAVLYVAWRLLDDPSGGAIKLNKVLHYAELGHVREFHRPITGARYQKLRMGPAPRPLLPVRTELINAGEATLETETFLGFQQERLVPRSEPTIKHLSADEVKSIDEALQLLSGMNGTEVSAMSHDEPGWQLVEIGDDIPFETAYLAPPDVTPAIRSHAQELVRSHGLG